MYLPVTKCCVVHLQGAAHVAVCNQQTFITIIATYVLQGAALVAVRNHQTFINAADKTKITYIGCGRPQGPHPVIAM